MSRGSGALRCGTAAVLVGLASGLAGCSLVLDFGGELTDAGVLDAPVSDAGNALCVAFEPNNTQATAAVTASGTYMAAICPGGDHDFYSFPLDGAQDLVVEIRFDNRGGLGDLEMFLYSDTGAVVGSSMGFTDVERIERSVALGGQLAAGTYAAEVIGFNNQRENVYELLLVKTPDDLPATDAGPTDGAVPDA